MVLTSSPKNSANSYLERDLFNAPEYTATYYYSRFNKNSVNVEDTYIQLVSDKTMGQDSVRITAGCFEKLRRYQVLQAK